MKYRKKPVEVDVEEYDGTYVTAGRIAEWMKSYGCEIIIQPMPSSTPQLRIPTLEGEMTAKEGDFIIKGVAGEFYPCKPDIFKKTYELTAEI